MTKDRDYEDADICRDVSRYRKEGGVGAGLYPYVFARHWLQVG
jgi:hypothetical protein